MVIYKKTRVKIGISIAILLITLLLIFQYQTIEIIYFTHPNCLLVNKTDKILSEIKEDFGDRVQIKEIKISMYPDDSPDTDEIKKLRERYQVYGVPEIIISGKEFTKEYTKYNLKEEICKNFLIKPGECK